MSFWGFKVEILVNELSLDGQFNTLEEFYDSLDNFIKVMKIAEEHQIKVLKKYDLYNNQITKSQTLRDIIKIRANDKHTRIRSLLLRTSSSEPYWEQDQKHSSDITYKCKFNDNLYGCSLAEAVERDKTLISFEHYLFKDKYIKVLRNDVITDLFNAINESDFLFYLYSNCSIINAIGLCNCKYKNTRLSFEKFEKQYGFEQLESNEVEMVLDAFDRFVQKSDWNDVFDDDSLRYKKYSPSRKKDNWFLNTVYEGMRIDKFRCGNTAVAPLRCFGHRDKDVFYVLRLERDHKISDDG